MEPGGNQQRSKTWIVEPIWEQKELRHVTGSLEGNRQRLDMEKGACKGADSVKTWRWDYEREETEIIHGKRLQERNRQK